MTTGIKR